MNIRIRLTLLFVSIFSLSFAQKEVLTLNADTNDVYLFYAKNGINLDSVVNKDLFIEVYDWLYTPYQYGAATKSGTDCSGFINNIFNKVYKQNTPRSSQAIFNQTKHVERDSLKEGNLVFFKIQSKNVSHVGIYVGNNKFAHATTKRGVIVSDLSQGYYNNYFYQGGEFSPVKK